MLNIRKKLNDEFQSIRLKSMHDTFKLMILYIYLLSNITNIFSSYDFDQKLFTFVIFSLVSCINYILVIMVERYAKDTVLQLRLYLLMSLFLTLVTAYSGPGKYMSTLGVAVVTYSVITFMVLSKKMLIFHAIFTGIIMAIATILGIGKTVYLGVGYPIAVIGSYGLMIITLMRAIEMFRKFEEVYYVQLNDINEMNVELVALNEEYQAVEQTLLYRIDHDDLTQALNRNGFDQSLNDLIIMQGIDHFYVVAFDIDNFKMINNSLGYRVGDKVLNEIVRQLKDYYPNVDNVARTEGNTLMLTVDKALKKELVVEKLRNILNHLEIDGYTFNLSATIGISDASNCKDATSLVKNAEMAMYKAKGEAKGTVAFHDQEYLAMMDRHYQIMNGISEALIQEEFYNLYQLIVDVKTKKLIGFEALVRWQSSNFGRVYPDEFITICE